MKVGAVVMAAGSSRRFGSDKRLYRQYGGEGEGKGKGKGDDTGNTLLQQTLKSVLSLGLPTVVMLRAEDAAHTAALLGAYTTAVSVGYVAEPERGLGHSIAQCFAKPPEWDGALLFLGDMPRVKAATVKHLLKAFTTNPQHIHAPVFDHQRGHPVLFPQCFFNPLAKLSGDSGAKALLKREQARVQKHVVSDAGVVWDMDVMPPNPGHESPTA